MQRRVAFFVFLMFIALSTHAAERGTYDLQRCIRAALENSPDLAAAAADLAAARARLAQAKAGRLGESTYTQYVGLVNQARGDVLNPKDDKNDYFEGLGPFTRLELNVSVPLYTFGKLDAALKAAEHGLASEQANAEKRRAEVVQNTRQLYYGHALALQLADILREMLKTMDEAVKRTEKRLEEGSSEVTELELLKLRIGQAKFGKAVAEIDASTRLTRSALARAIGLPMDAELEIAERRLQPVDAEIVSLDAYLAAAVQQRPEWRQLSSGVAAQEAIVALEQAKFYPTFFLATGLHFARAGNRDEQENPFAYDEFNFIRPIGVLGVRWELNFYATHAKVSAARADLERIRARERETITGLELELRKAYSDVMQARATIEAAEQGRKAARALLVLTVTNFDLGIGDAEELFTSLGSYTEASADYLRAVHDYNIAVGALGKAVGRELTTLRY